MKSLAANRVSPNQVPTTPQVLMIDADDTLWENNIYFEQAIDRFVDLVAHPELPPAEVRATFNALESSRVKVHGYGTDAFHASLLVGFQHLTGMACGPQQEQQIAHCAASVRNSALDLLEGVAETLPRLAAKHTLILVTKGAHDEQTEKLRRSGLECHFLHVEVLREKHADAYRHLLRLHGCDPAHTWMIGNSPRSDINPALEAGMHAIHLPHASTWILEQDDITAPSPPQTLLQLKGFRDLLHYFA